MHPGLAIRPLQKAIRLVVAFDLLLLGVPGQGPAELHGVIREDATGRRDVALLDVGHGLPRVAMLAKKSCM